jgi:HEPN domain-containing protein
MERIDLIRQEIEDIYEVERKMVKNYQDLLDRIIQSHGSDPLYEQLQEVYNDELKHVNICRSMVKLLDEFMAS